MFYWCLLVQELIVGDFNVRNVINMMYMFRRSSSLKELNIYLFLFIYLNKHYLLEGNLNLVIYLFIFYLAIIYVGSEASISIVPSISSSFKKSIFPPLYRCVQA